MISKVNWISFHRYLQICIVEFNGTNENNTHICFRTKWRWCLTKWRRRRRCETCFTSAKPFSSDVTYQSLLLRSRLLESIISEFSFQAIILWQVKIHCEFFFTMTSLLDLPLELLHYVLDFLPLSSVYRLGAVCRHLHRLVHQDDEFWRRRVKLELQLRLLNPDWQCSYKEEVEYT